MRWKSLAPLLLALLFACVLACNRSRYNPPDDHTTEKSGARHKSGLQDPAKNCVSCHGADLRGGSSKVSCFACHSNKWTGK